MSAAGQGGKLIILSGPSGAGKSTVVQRLLQQPGLPLQLSVSATTRSARPGEQDGEHYHFLSHEEFSRRRIAGDFLECKEVFGGGDWYGTLHSEVATGLREGKWVLLEIDVDGACSVLEQYPEAITIFLHPGSPEELERRLRLRGTESEESIRLRLETARQEMNQLNRYLHEVVNDIVENAVRRIRDILMQNGDAV